MEMREPDRNAADAKRPACTPYEAFRVACTRWPSKPFLAMTPLAVRDYLPEGFEITYEAALAAVEECSRALQSAGYGMGHRVGILVENRPQHFIFQLACNANGISIVPLNPDLRDPELAYILDHSDLDLVLAIDQRVEGLRKLATECRKRVQVVPYASLDYPAPPVPAREGQPGPATEASLLYTSGTTGAPKGCLITNEYYEYIGNFYKDAGGICQLREGEERILNPLPVFHQNAGIFTLMGVIASGSCLVVTDRFHASSWWREVAESRATIIHYLGVMPALLLKLPPADEEMRHCVRFGVGAGVEPELHAAFEARFGFPLIELWGSTETGGGFMASVEPRMIDTRAVGRPGTRVGIDFDIRLVDQDGRDVATGMAGELLVRRSGADPGRGMFAGYLKDEQATAAAWHGGWFHTGDVFRQDESGMLFFVDRNKNIIRRSGENIAAAEIEATLLAHDGVEEVAVFAVPDELRNEEVMACIIPSPGRASDATLAQEVFDWCFGRLAYYKAPGWILFVDSLPKTSTQKVQKRKIFSDGEDPRTRPGVLDFRSRKKKTGSAA